MSSLLTSTAAFGSTDSDETPSRRATLARESRLTLLGLSVAPPSIATMSPWPPSDALCSAVAPSAVVAYASAPAPINAAAAVLSPYSAATIRAVSPLSSAASTADFRPCATRRRKCACKTSRTNRTTVTEYSCQSTLALALPGFVAEKVEHALLQKMSNELCCRKSRASFVAERVAQA
eukprot:3997595-Pleurochrysis_carterae.AAC.2